MSTSEQKQAALDRLNKVIDNLDFSPKHKTDNTEKKLQKLQKAS